MAFAFLSAAFAEDSIPKVLVKCAILLNRYSDRSSRLAVRNVFSRYSRIQLMLFIDKSLNVIICPSRERYTNPDPVL